MGHRHTSLSKASTSHFAAANANSNPCSVTNLSTDSNVSESNSGSLSSPHMKPDAEEKSTESISPGPPISTQSTSTDTMAPANPSDLIHGDSIRTETVVSSSRQPDKINSASSFDDSMFISICHFYGLEYAKRKAEQMGWRLSKTPESLLEDEVQRHAAWYRADMMRGFAVLPPEQKAAIKAGVFRGRK